MSDMSDLPIRFRDAADRAAQTGFVGAFPNFYKADRPGGTVVGGTIFVKSTTAEWRDVFLEELGNPALDDVGARFRATQDYAVHHGFIGGFPNLYHADHGSG